MPLTYIKTIGRALIPKKTKDIIVLMCLTGIFTYVGWGLFIQIPPEVTVYSETQYPKTVPRGGYFYLTFDLAFNKDCRIEARRFIRASDNVLYLAQEDIKDVRADERIQYVVKVPVGDSIPLGKGLVQSKFAYRCDFWSRWLRPIELWGQARPIEIVQNAGLDPAVLPLWPDERCALPPRDGFIVVRSYYRKKAR